MFLFSVVIDYADNPHASTGKFECSYRTPAPIPYRYGINGLEVKGVALPTDYFYKGKIEVEECSYTSNMNDEQRDINKMLKKLKTMYESDIMKIPDCDDYLDNFDVNKTKSDILLEDENNTVNIDLTLDKMTSDQSITSKRVSDCQSSTSMSSINLLRKCYQSKSASNVKSILKNSLTRYTSSVACTVPFLFSKLDDESDGKTSRCSLIQRDLQTSGPSNCTPDVCSLYSKYYVHSKMNINKSLHMLLENEFEANRQFAKNKQTVQEITKKIFDFLEKKENEYILNENEYI